MQIWRWHVTMAASILFRATIGAASVGAILVTAWLGAVAFGPDAHAAATDFLASPLGLLIGFGLTVVLFSFFLNGARHTINDTGNGLTPKTSDVLSWIAVVGPVVLAVAFWAVLMGASA
jgi:succinate dehydrogenase / fumarate reductase cytochrome b subunit